jgi:hypothetical protein
LGADHPAAFADDDEPLQGFHSRFPVFRL